MAAASTSTPLDGCLEGAGPLLQGDSEKMRVPSIKYDVFLNHRGPDVKKTFVSHLSAALQRVNFSCFLDCENIQKGDPAKQVMKSAIHHSKIHIAVFTPGYAGSEWCLDELFFIMECFRKRSSECFLPIFYNVRPSDLCLLKSSRKSCYNSSFEKHAKTFEATVINNWKKALHEAANVGGYIFPDDFQGFEARLVEQIVSKVIEVLSQSTLLHGPEHPVGVDAKLQDALDHMKRGVSRSGVRKFGICGMGGLGKTTLAKSIYNRIHREFESACFMQNVTEISRSSRGLVGLQQDLLQELLKTREIYIANTARGKQIMREQLEGRKVLIILDDVSEKKQLDELMPPSDCHLGEGSQVVITTRDRQILYWARAETSFPMEGLSRHLALQLFNLHAFPSIENSSTDCKQLHTGTAAVPLKSLTKKVATACQGLPLALEILGSHLQGKDISEWEATVKVLENNKMVDSQTKVTEKLIISYNALSFEEEKKMFLDIACFLFQEPKDKAMRIWGSDFGDESALLHLESLIRKCLVKVDENGYLTMHALLRDMGRQIVDNSHKDYWQRSHLWRDEEVESVLKKRKGKSRVRGLSSSIEKEWDTLAFKNMDHLKLLVLNRVNLTGDFSFISQELRWLQLRNCSLDRIPLLLHLDKVAVLDLEGSKLTSFSCGTCILQNLRELNLNHCSNLSELLIDFSMSCKSLEVLMLSGCANLEQLPDSLSELSSSLRYLDVSHCSKLTTLPDAIGKLTALGKIGLDGVGLSNLPESFGLLSSLVSLCLHQSSKLRELPSTIGGLASLVHFRISDCVSISQLPESIGHLTRLEELHVCDMVNLVSLPCSISLLSKLKLLNLEGCRNLCEIPELPSSLASLAVGSCTGLKSLDLRGCYNLHTLPDGLESLCKLSHLDLSNSRHLFWMDTSSLEKLTALKTLKFASFSTMDLGKRAWIQRMVSVEEVVMVGLFPWQKSMFGSMGSTLEMVVPESFDTANPCSGMLCNAQLEHLYDPNEIGSARDDQCLTATLEVLDGGNGGQKIYQQDLCSHHVWGLHQVQVACLYRASHPLVATLRGGDIIRLCTRGATTLIAEGSIKLLSGENGMQEYLGSKSPSRKKNLTSLQLFMEKILRQLGLSRSISRRRANQAVRPRPYEPSSEPYEPRSEASSEPSSEPSKESCITV